MTPVQISEKIRDHLIAQNARALDGHRCRYRGANSTKCAVGCLIDDEHFDSDAMEGNGVGNKAVRHALIMSGIHYEFSDPVHELLARWQAYHDNAFGDWLLSPDTNQSPQSTHERLMENFGI